MAVTLICPYCKREGFVRFETVIARGVAHRHYYCGACGKTWQLEATAPDPPADSRMPKAKRA